MHSGFALPTVAAAGGSPRNNLADAPSNHISDDILTFFLERRSVTEWESADDRNNREKSARARQAAEDLFKPVHQDVPAEAPISEPNSAASADQQPRRRPRIFAIPPRVPVSAASEPPVKPEPMRRKPAARRQSGSVQASQIGRVRALTSYGMTRAQVAELYGVSVDEIERVIRKPAYGGKSR
jgi:hypothetical protein